MFTPAPNKSIAYLTSRYPAMSHTFILREIEALKQHGLTIVPCSIRKPDMRHLTGAPEQKAAAETFYVLAAARRLMPLLAAQALLFQAPRRYLRTIALAWRTSAPGLRAHLYQLFYFVEATVLARHFRQHNITHLHNHFADMSANVAMLAAELADIPFSYTLHGPAELFEPQRWHLAQKTARAKFVVCISHFARSQAMYFSDPADWHKLKIIHCGVTASRYGAKSAPQRNAAATPLPTSQERPIKLVFVGRLTAIKGLRVLMDAFETARQAFPQLHLTLIGEGDERAFVEQRAGTLGGSVSLTGYQNQAQVADHLAQADIFVLPSFAEGVPVVLMEAMASRVPVISSLVAGIPELVEDGVSGYLVAPGDGAALASRIVTLAGDAKLRARMGAAGHKSVRAEFDTATEAARIAALFHGQAGDDIRPAPLDPQGVA